jgi:hypothetical protein
MLTDGEPQVAAVRLLEVTQIALSGMPGGDDGDGRPPDVEANDREEVTP